MSRAGHEQGAQDYEELGRHLRSLALTLIHEEFSADDLVQEAWLAALDAPAGQVRDMNLWLRKVVANLARRSYEQAQRRREVEQFAARAERTSADSTLDAESTRELLTGAIGSLRDPYRSVLSLRYFDELPVKEIAARLGASPATVRSQLQRGLAELRAVLDRSHGGRRSAWVSALVPWLGLASSQRPPLTAAPQASSRRLILALGLGAITLLTAALLWRSGSPAEQEAVAHLEADADRAPSRLETSSPPEGSPVERVEARASVPERPPSPPAEAGYRNLHVIVQRADGTPAIQGLVSLDGRNADPIRNPDHPEGGWMADLEGRVTIAVPEEMLEGAPKFPDTPGVALSARDRDEAWSMVSRATLPPEGKTLTLRCRGPAQDLRLELVDEANAPLEGAVVLLRGRRIGDYRAVDDAPLSDIDATYVSDSSGEVFLSALPIRDHTLMIRAAGKPALERVLSRSEPFVHETIVVSDGCTLFGQALMPDKTPARGVRIWLPDPEFDLRSLALLSTLGDEDGYFELEGLGPGDHRVFAAHAQDPSLFASTVVRVLDDEETVWDPILERVHPLRVRAVDLQDRPLAGAAVVVGLRTLPVWGTLLPADDQGRARFDDVPAGELVARVYTDYRGYDPTIVEGLGRGPEEVLIRVHPIRSLASLTAVLVDESGSPLRDARLILVDPSSDGFDAPARPESGRVGLVNLDPGVYTVAIRVAELGQFLVGEIELEEGTQLDLGELRVPAATEVQLDWRAAAPSPEHAWEVRVFHSDFPPLDRVRSLQRPTSRLRLIPGRYELNPIGRIDLALEFVVPNPSGGSIIVR